MSCVGHFVFMLGQWSTILPYQIPCWDLVWFLAMHISCSMVVLYIRDHGDLGFPRQKIHPKTSFTTPSWHPGSIG